MKRILTATALGLITLTAPLAASAEKACPPGLAKKDPACVPPGLAKKMPQGGKADDDKVYYEVRRGEPIPDRYILLENPSQYGLDPNRTYYHLGNQVVRVDPDTRAVLSIIGAIAELSN